MPRERFAFTLVVAFALVAAIRLLGEQGVRLGPWRVPLISAWYLLPFGIGVFLCDRDRESTTPLVTLVCTSVVLGLLYWPLDTWRARVTRHVPISARVYRASQPASPPERAAFLDTLRFPARNYVNRLAGRRRDVAVEVDGSLVVPWSGSYRLETVADDFLLLQIDGETVLRQTGRGSADVRLLQGTHRLRLRYEQWGGPASLELHWDRPGFVELLPLEHYLSDRPTPSSHLIRWRELQNAIAFALLALWWFAASCTLARAGHVMRLSRRHLAAYILGGRGTRPMRAAGAFSWVVLEIVLLVGLLEFVASFFTSRPADWVIGHLRLNHTWKPNSSRVHRVRDNPEFGPFLQVFNSQSWIETYDVSKDKPRNVYRIFYVGDSFVEGPAPMEQTVPSRVEQYLNETYSRLGTRFEVINTGTASYSPIIQYILIRYFLAEYSPDLVVLNVDMTDDYDDCVYRQNLVVGEDGNPWAVPQRDVYEQMFVDTEFGVVQVSPLTKLRLFLYERSYLYNFFRERIPISEGRRKRLEEAAVRRSESLGVHGVYQRWSWCRNDWDSLTEENVAFTMSVLRQIATYCRRERIKLLLTGVPHYPQYATGDGERPRWSKRPHLEIEKVAKETGVSYFDSHARLLPSIEGTKQEVYYYRNDMHFNPKGLELWSKAHIAALTDHQAGLLPESVIGR